MKLQTTLAMVLLSLSASGWAQTSPLPDWDRLTPEQREALIAPLRDRWNNAAPPQRQRMLQHGHRWESMTPEQRELARRGRHRFENMTPAQREQARALFAQMRSMTPDQREALRERWGKMTPEQRQEWLKANAVKDDPAPR